MERIGRRNDAVTDEDIRAMRARQTEIAALVSKERYPDLQKRAPEEMTSRPTSSGGCLMRHVVQPRLGRADGGAPHWQRNF